jgi:uncharacterized membrane protein
MVKFKALIGTSLLGGFVVILPLAILLGAFRWIFGFITTLIQPITHLLFAKSNVKEIIGHLIVLIIIAMICFILGVIIKTEIGKLIHDIIEDSLLKKIPGYMIVKETILQFVGNKKSPFSSVCVANIFQNETLVTAFITDEHQDGSFTIFVPTGPNPTSGNIFHLKAQYVHKSNASVEDTMRSIISCGSGSKKVISGIKRASNC